MPKIGILSIWSKYSDILESGFIDLKHFYRYINELCTNNYRKVGFMKKSLVLSLHAFINWYILRSSCMSVPYRRRKFEHETIRGLRKEVVWNILYIIIASKHNCYIQNNNNIIIWVSLFELKLILTIVFLRLRIHIQLKYKLIRKSWMLFLQTISIKKLQ